MCIRDSLCIEDFVLKKMETAVMSKLPIMRTVNIKKSRLLYVQRKT